MYLHMCVTRSNTFIDRRVNGNKRQKGMCGMHIHNASPLSQATLTLVRAQWQAKNFTKVKLTYNKFQLHTTYCSARRIPLSTHATITAN